MASEEDWFYPSDTTELVFSQRRSGTLHTAYMPERAETGSDDDLPHAFRAHPESDVSDDDSTQESVALLAPAVQTRTIVSDISADDSTRESIPLSTVMRSTGGMLAEALKPISQRTKDNWGIEWDREAATLHNESLNTKWEHRRRMIQAITDARGRQQYNTGAKKDNYEKLCDTFDALWRNKDAIFLTVPERAMKNKDRQPKGDWDFIEPKGDWKFIVDYAISKLKVAAWRTQRKEAVDTIVDWDAAEVNIRGGAGMAMPQQYIEWCKERKPAAGPQAAAAPSHVSASTAKGSTKRHRPPNPSEEDKIKGSDDESERSSDDEGDVISDDDPDAEGIHFDTDSDTKSFAEFKEIMDAADTLNSAGDSLAEASVAVYNLLSGFENSAYDDNGNALQGLQGVDWQPISALQALKRVKQAMSAVTDSYKDLHYLLRDNGSLLKDPSLFKAPPRFQPTEQEKSEQMLQDAIQDVERLKENAAFAKIPKAGLVDWVEYGLKSLAKDPTVYKHKADTPEKRVAYYKSLLAYERSGEQLPPDFSDKERKLAEDVDKFGLIALGADRGAASKYKLNYSFGPGLKSVYPEYYQLLLDFEDAGNAIIISDDERALAVQVSAYVSYYEHASNPL